MVHHAEFAPGRRATFGVVLTVHNRATSLNRTLPTLLPSVGGEWELAVVLDDCTDGSRAALLQLLPRAAPECALQASSAAGSSNASSAARPPAGIGSPAAAGFLLRLVVVEAVATPLFETASEGLGMRLLDPSLAYVLVQSDVVFMERGWNFVLASAMAADRRVVLVSGRCVQPGQRSHHLYCAGTGHKPRAHVPLERQAAALRGLAPRGPTLLRASAARALGFWDETCFWQGGDDFDLQRRAHEHFGWLAAYVYVDAFQPKSLHQWDAAKSKPLGGGAGAKSVPPFGAWRADAMPRAGRGVPCRYSTAEALEKEWSRFTPDEREPFSLNVSWLREAFAARAGGGCGGGVPGWVRRLASVGVGRNNTYIRNTHDTTRHRPASPRARTRARPAGHSPQPQPQLAHTPL